MANWFACNREYVPLGKHTKTSIGFSMDQTEFVSASYNGLTERLLKELAISDESIGYDNEGKILKFDYMKQQALLQSQKLHGMATRLG